MSFERLLYTDCRAGQGRSGGGGFQIQAQSAGVTPVLAKMAVETLLYARQSEWVGSTRAIEDFPLGLAHTARDGWATAQSRYLGQEATGGRQGNHLADCLLTADPEPYGAIRPAQLFESEVWRGEPFESIDCPPFNGFLQPGPLTNDDLQDWLRDEERRTSVLKRLVSVLLDPNGPKVVILADRTEAAVRWIAAATILLPIRAALDLSFKVFVNSISQASQRIVAVPKELNQNVRVDASDSRFVVDATEDMSSSFEVAAIANYWVERLIEADDAYDVVEAVDLADVLGGHDDPTLAADAHETAWVAIAEGVRPSNPSRLVRWLKAPKDPSLAEYEVAIASRLIESDLADDSTLFWMERQADAGRLAVDRAPLRRALITAEIAAAPTAFNVRSDELSPVDVGDEARRDAESAISSALLQADDSGVVDRLLRTAKRHGIPLKLAPLKERLHLFIADWIAYPSYGFDPGLWALSESLMQDLTSQLSSPTEFAGGYSRVRPLLARAWTYLLPRVGDPRSPLAWELNAASAATAREQVKMRQLRSVVNGLVSADDGYEALAGFQRALVSWRALSGREAMFFADSVMPPRAWPAPEFADLLWTGVREAARRPDRLVLDTIWRLNECRRLPASHTTDELLRADQHIANFLTEATAITSEESLIRLRDLKRVDPTVMSIRLPDFVDVSIGSPMSAVGPALLDRLPNKWHRDFFRAWARALTRGQSVDAAASGYLWCNGETYGLSGWERDYVGTQIADYSSQLSDHERAEWLGSVKRRIGALDGDGFEDFIGYQGRGLRQRIKSVRTAPDGLPKHSKLRRPEQD